MLDHRVLIIILGNDYKRVQNIFLIIFMIVLVGCGTNSNYHQKILEIKDNLQTLDSQIAEKQAQLQVLDQKKQLYIRQFKVIFQPYLQPNQILDETVLFDNKDYSGIDAKAQVVDIFSHVNLLANNTSKLKYAFILDDYYYWEPLYEFYIIRNFAKGAILGITDKYSSKPLETSIFFTEINFLSFFIQGLQGKAGQKIYDNYLLEYIGDKRIKHVSGIHKIIPTYKVIKKLPRINAVMREHLGISIDKIQKDIKTLERQKANSEISLEYYEYKNETE